MSHDDRILAYVREEQREIFRIARRDLQLELKAIADLAGIPISTTKTYASGECQMPVSVLKRLLSIDGFAPILSRLFVPEGFMLVPKRDETDHDGLAAEAIDYAGAHARARHPNSPGGVEIVPSEKALLDAKATTLRAVGGATGG